MNRNNLIVLLGAGFSRNWGGWLASEAFEYLLGCPELDESIRNLLWKHKKIGGFESALSEIQEESRGTGQSSHRLTMLQSAIQNMFADMNAAYEKIPFEFQSVAQDYRSGLVYFLSGFNAIFTLNQDLLLEQHYIKNDNVFLQRPGRWDGTSIPGIKIISGSNDPLKPAYCGKCIPDESTQSYNNRTQPYFKLHGSCNWITPKNENLLVVGGNKNSLIDQHAHLKWSFEKFTDYLGRESTRLVIIGYSFSDEHINRHILEAAQRKNLSLFIIDPHGLDVVGDLVSDLYPYIRGSSRRSLSEIFSRDVAEHKKVLRFCE